MSEKTFKIISIFKMDKDEAELDMIKACKQLVRKYGDFLNIEAKYSENIYLNILLSFFSLKLSCPSLFLLLTIIVFRAI